MAKRRESIAQLDAFLQSTFLDIFGDPCDNPKGWEERPPEKIVLETKLGLVRSSKEYGWGYSVPYVRKSDKVEVVGPFQSSRFVNGRDGTLGLLGGNSFHASEPVFVERRLFCELSQAWFYISPYWYLSQFMATVKSTLLVFRHGDAERTKDPDCAGPLESQVARRRHRPVSEPQNRPRW